jgi:Tfp pilus assembly protein PilX
MKTRYKRLINKKREGVTSILVVIAVAVVLTIIISGIAAVTVRELRQASNTELSSRALQTAEAGVKSIVQKLNSDPTWRTTGTQTTTNGVTTGDISACATKSEEVSVLNTGISDTSQTITCAVVKSNFNGSYESYLEKDKATQVFLGEAYTSISSNATNTPQYLKISWNEESLDKPTKSVYPENGDLYPVTEGYEYPAAMEITIISWPSSGLSATNAEVATIFVMPGRADEGYTNKTGRTQVATNCNGTPYKCNTNNASNKPGFDIFAALGKPANNTTKFAVRVKPRYANTHYKIEAYNSESQPVNIASSKAQIDVTAKVGNLYRRVKAEKVVLPSSVENVFDSVLFAGNNVRGDTPGKDICKNIVTKQVAGVYQFVTVPEDFRVTCN